MHVLIIGGGGFLGQRLARELLVKGGLVEGGVAPDDPFGQVISRN